MASPGDPPNQVTAPPPTFDINKFFAPPLTTTSAAAHHQIQLPYPPLPTSSYPPPASTFAFQNHAPPLFHHQPAAASPPPNLFIDRSLSYPTPPLHAPNPSPNPNSNPNAGAQLMALLSGMPTPSPPGSSVFPGPAFPPGGPARLPSSKVLGGRYLTGDSVVYDVDVRIPGEAQPQLEVTPITRYASDPQLVLGRQIAVNKSYICYGLNQGNIRVLNVHTASRFLLRGHSERITDMAFFAEDVGLLASISKDGRVCVWKIVESPAEDGKVQISADMILAIQVQGGEESVHPRVCWHCHKQEILVVGVGRHIFRIDTTKLGKGDAFSAEEPMKCPLDKLVDGVQLIGEHDGEITDLSMCQWMTSRLVSASTDGTIKIWADQKKQPLLVLRPHGGLPVNTATFVTSPHRPDHVLLITAGPLNREIKVWTSLSEASEEGWLLISDVESWECTQTLDMKSSSQPHEDSFFNQFLVLPQACLLLLANGKRNAIYAVHLEFGPNPATSKMNYLAEFTVTMPILSFTGITEISPSGERVVQIYCVQTQAIQQYALDLFLCMPPPLESFGLQNSESSVSYDVSSFEGSGSTKQTNFSSVDSAPNLSENSSLSDAVTATVDVGGTPDPSSVNAETRTTVVEQEASDSDIVCLELPSPLPASPTFSGHLPGLSIPTIVSGEMPVVAIVDGDLRNGEKNTEDEKLELPNPTVNFKPPTHLVTPSEILRAAPSFGKSDAVKDKTEKNGNSKDETVDREVDFAEVGVEVVANESVHKDGFSTEEPTYPLADNAKIFFSQASDLGISIARERLTVSSEKNAVHEGLEANALEVTAPPPPAEVNVSSNFVCDKVSEPPATELTPQTCTPPVKSKKQKRKNSQAMASSSSPSAFNSADSSNEAIVNSNSEMEAQILAIRDKLNQVMAMSKELKKQMSATVNAPVSNEGRRLEAALARNMEKIAKANSDALWARFHEENSKKEKRLQDQLQKTVSLISNFMNKDVPAMLERSLKKELQAIQTSILRAITPAIEKIVSSTIAESFQKGVSDKSVNQLDKSISAKLEAAVAKQILAQFQTSAKQAIQDGLKSSLEASVVPGFEAACKALFGQVEAAFQSGLTEHTSAAIQHLNSANSSLTVTLQDAISSASSMTNALTGELADGQRKLLSLALAGANSSAINPLVSQLSNGNLLEKFELPPVDPRKQLSLLISELKYEEAFTLALQRTDASVVSWLCSQVDLRGVLAVVPLPLSQGVLLSLLQQLACDISSGDATRKLSWMTDIVGALNPTDPLIVMHVRPIFEQVYQILNHQRSTLSHKGPDFSSIRLLMHVINSMLTTCK